MQIPLVTLIAKSVQQKLMEGFPRILSVDQSNINTNVYNMSSVWVAKCLRLCSLLYLYIIHAESVSGLGFG